MPWMRKGSSIRFSATATGHSEKKSNWFCEKNRGFGNAYACVNHEEKMDVLCLRLHERELFYRTDRTILCETVKKMKIAKKCKKNIDKMVSKRYNIKKTN